MDQQVLAVIDFRVFRQCHLEQYELDTVLVSKMDQPLVPGQ
ncbi:MAG TPA: hypothetical protein VFQ88_06150 [Nevskiaceae bacterium]|nr:hypothetical protein [Nevskiaceae bacterium]